MRTTPDLVRAAIGVPCTVDDQQVDVSPFIETASDIVDYIVTKDKAGILTAAPNLAKRIETYLACFFLALKYQKFSTKTTGDASATFQTGQPDRGFFNQNDWGRAALGIDPTGELAVLNDPDKALKRVQFGWLGTPNNAMIPWWRRDPLTNC